jgi:cyanobactin maturation PatA/PatG family protease
VDLDRACFQGAALTKMAPYWQPEPTIDPQDLETFLAIDTSDASDLDKVAQEQEALPDPEIRTGLHLAAHATHVASVLFGQPGSPVEGIVPHCRGINIPIAYDEANFLNPINLIHALNLALEQGAQIIHIAACHPTQTGVAHELLEKAIRQCLERNVLLVAPGGNDGGECWCLPALLPGVLVVGAMKESGEPFGFSNWGGQYQDQGLLAPGESIWGAQIGTDQPVKRKGTSCAAPIVTGIAALLMAVQLQRGATPDAQAIRAALLNSAIPCNLTDTAEPDRCLAGKVNISGAYGLLTGEALTQKIENSSSVDLEPLTESLSTEDLENSNLEDLKSPAELALIPAIEPSNSEFASKAVVERNNLRISNIYPSAASRSLIYALGNLDYDFGSEARRDSFKQLMPTFAVDDTLVPANPYDARQMVDYLGENPSEVKALIWTLNLELTPIYALEPQGAFAAEIYALFQQLLAGQIEPLDSSDYLDHISIPGRLTDRTVRLFSGQYLPIVEVEGLRGIYGWHVNNLVEAAISSVTTNPSEAQETALRRSLTSFLNRVYYDFRNSGQMARDRALNFAATNAFQAAMTFQAALATGMELDTIEVEKSPYCRLHSDCWDVKLKFFDPENRDRAKRVFRFTIDVVDTLPVTLGEVRSWAVSD